MEIMDINFWYLYDTGKYGTRVRSMPNAVWKFY